MKNQVRTRLFGRSYAKKASTSASDGISSSSPQPVSVNTL